MTPRIFTAPRCAAALLSSLLLLPGASIALTLEQALQLAESEAPALAAQRANFEAARSAAIPAGELPDPQLRLGVQNLPIEGDARWQLGEEAMTMQMVGVMQQVPNRAKREARVDAAEASIAVAAIQQRLTRLQVRQQAAQAWIATLAIERKLELFTQLYRENELLEKAVGASLAGGAGLSSDSIAPRQEALELANQEDLLRRDEAIARAELRRWIGDAAGQALTGDWPQWTDDLSHYQHNLERHPELQVFDPLTRQAEADIAEAVADKTPDWAWGVDYQRRGRGFGDMVSLSVSMDLPVFAGSRQDPKIAAERARLAEVQAQREEVLRMHDRELAEDLAEYQRVDKALERIEQTLLPLAEEKVRLAMADYRGGRGQLSVVIQARQQLVETRLRAVDLARDRALSNARLHFAFGDAP
ncbi:Outer membrane protein TolC [Halopseudomonas xinjiangensis]|uniref:Outer membrane protein TolC n=1 Tax=Halopseudomonas xinjiangensis TaxID=487184 RepID=A0A1H1T3E3_9GAMM|nr:TolC family protein [Halopseudomonas xinjiangensis]SDS54691.1 Outer membrane protein TolC [Halopseudomonas xinjiangensis]